MNPKRRFRGRSRRRLAARPRHSERRIRSASGRQPPEKALSSLFGFEAIVKPRHHTYVVSSGC